MKYKALALSLLLIVPMFALFAPVAKSVNQPALWINPKNKEFWGPCIVSTEFTVDVMLFNNKDMTGVGVYAYDFYFNWDVAAGITLLSAEPHFPWPEGEYFVVADEIDNDLGWYHLAVTALGTQEEGELTDVQISLLTLVFHIDEEPCWPDSMTTTFWLEPVELSTGCGQIIDPFEVDDGGYTIHSSKPKIDIEATESPPFPDSVTSCAIDSTFSVYIHLTNIVNAYGFGFILTFDPAWKKTDVQHITILPTFAPPYELLYVYVDDGYVEVEVIRPCEKPTFHGKDFAVVKIDFVETAEPEIGVVPFENTSYIALTDAWLYIKCPDPTVYNFIEADAIKAAADRLVALQGTTDPGWDWVVTGLAAHSATYPSPKNIWGVTAIGLSEAYMLTNDVDYLTAALNVADYWLALGDPTTGVFWTSGFGYSWDYRFLMEISQITGDSSYADFALDSWAWQKANHPTLRYADGNQMQLWDRYCNFWIGPNSYGAAAWGTGDWGLATLAMGDTSWADNMAAVVHANMTNILATPVDTDYKDLGIGKALEFFATLGDPAYDADIEAMIDQLEADQLADNSWGYGPLYPGDVQVTAYVVIGLCAAGEHVLCQQGVDWLVANQMTAGVGAGGWDLGGYEISEVDSEALKALVTCNGYSGDLANIFKPKSRADLNLDCIVDIEDLAALAEYYGELHPWTALNLPDDPLSDPVDIYDFVYVGKRYLDP